MTSSDGAIAAANLGAILLEISTVSPQTSQRIHEAAKQRNLPILDAAVLGSTLQAKEGSLLILVGGDEDVYHKCNCSRGIGTSCVVGADGL